MVLTSINVCTKVDRKAWARGTSLSLPQILDAQPLLPDESEQIEPLALLDAPEHMFLRMTYYRVSGAH